MKNKTATNAELTPYTILECGIGFRKKAYTISAKSLRSAKIIAARGRCMGHTTLVIYSDRMQSWELAAKVGCGRNVRWVNKRKRSCKS